MRDRIVAVTALCLALGISAQVWADSAKDAAGTRIGEMKWATVAPERATVRLPAALAVSKHEANTAVANRYHERITLQAGGYVFYEWLANGLNTDRGIAGQAALVHRADKTLKDFGIAVEDGDYQVTTIAGRTTARAVKSGVSKRCLTFYAWAGEARGVRSGADQQLFGGQCRDANTSTDAGMLAEWDRYLSEIRIVSER